MDPSDAEMDFQWLHELEASAMGQQDTRCFSRVPAKGSPFPKLPPRQSFASHNHRTHLQPSNGRMSKLQPSGFLNSMQALPPKRQHPVLQSKLSISSSPSHLPPVPVRQSSLQRSTKSTGALSRRNSSVFLGDLYEGDRAVHESMENEIAFPSNSIQRQRSQGDILSISELNFYQGFTNFVHEPPEVIKTVDVDFGSTSGNSWNKRDSKSVPMSEERKKGKATKKASKGSTLPVIERSNSKDSSVETKTVLKEKTLNHPENAVISPVGNSKPKVPTSPKQRSSPVPSSPSIPHSSSARHSFESTQKFEQPPSFYNVSESNTVGEPGLQQKEIIFAQEKELLIQRQEKQMALEEKQKGSFSVEDSHDASGLAHSAYKDDGMLLDVAKVLACPTADIKDFYIMGKELGRGHFGVVYLCEDLLAGEKLACKSVSKASLKTQLEVKELRAEISVMNLVSGHPHIIELREVYEDEVAVHLVMELCREGDLFDYISRQGRLNERDAARIFRQIILAIGHCHEKGIVHRDVKPENILFSKVFHNQGEHEVKLGDFGLAVKKLPHQQVKGLTGSPFYMAPEVIQNKPYGFEVDIWSAGVVLYTALSGFLPFWGQTQEETFSAVCRGEIDLTKPPWSSVSSEAKSLIQTLLCVDPLARPTVADILSHPWVVSHSKLFSSVNRQKALNILSHLPYPSPPESPIFTPSLLTPSLSRSDLLGTVFSSNSSFSMSRPLSSQSILSLNRSRKSFGRRELTPSSSISNRDRLTTKQFSTSSQNEEELKFIESLMF